MKEKYDIFSFYGFNEDLGILHQYREFTIKSWDIDVLDVVKNFILNNMKESGKIVEVGVQGGGSFLSTFDLITNTNIELYGVDIWEDIYTTRVNGISNDFWTEDSIKKLSYLLYECRVNLENILNKYDEKNQCKLIKGNSSSKDILDKFDNDSVDLIYIDADHSFEGAYNDFVSWFPKLKSGGLLVGDDYFWAHGNGVNTAANKFCQDNGLDINIVSNKFYIFK